MRSRSWKLRIRDIVDAVRTILGYLGYIEGMTFDDFVRDQRTMDAVVRRLTIIGEAAARVPELVCEKYRHIPWAEMRAMRNFIVHEYFGISEQILWETIQMDLPAIVGPLEALLVSGKEVDET
ncbi:MAG TPA: DUF86 domain-containing protein [Synergistales bacterium]|nr:DUF86 domain-containing protein [Synergistales bacterium]